ncbi:MAG: carbohydrate-binding domain-containing protein [Prevotellaceae bacterium]|jgi:hypothetical protein|nr:carbohydrate-binding domain-containing protein [Prevotellaceae bacterium]
MEKKKLFFVRRMFCYISISACFLALSTCKSDDSDFKEEASRTYSISGAVTKSDGGAAAGASIMLVNASNNDAGQSPANAAGEYIITGVAAGSYRVTATLNGYETASIEAVTVANADVTGQDIVLKKITVPTYAITGAVTTPDGNAAAGASVQVRRASDNTCVGQADTTNEAGVYSIGDIPAGTYNIIVSLSGYEAGVIAGVAVSNANLASQNVALQAITTGANAIQIIYSDNDAAISNLPSDGSVTATKAGADVTIASSSLDTVELYVSGVTSGGSLKIQNNASAPNTLRLTLNSAVITSASKLPPIQITKNEGVTIVELKGSSILSDHSSNEENATLISKSGSLEFEGYGKLAISGAAKHAIASSKKSIAVRGGDIAVTSAASDGFHAEAGFTQSGGSLSIAAASGDGIDAGTGVAEISGGDIKISSSADDVKGIKADAGVTLSGGIVAVSVSGAQSKGISSKADITVSGGSISIVTSGATALVAAESGDDPSYCTAIKSDANVTVTGGTIQIESRATSDGGKGISADGDIRISGGTLSITTAGDGKTYTAATGSPDSYTAACIKSDKNITLLGGSITCRSSGAGGKCISADGTIAIGAQGGNNADLVLTVGTSGERFYVSGSTGGRPGGGGFGDNGTDYANPKAIKCEGNMTINSGTIIVSCTQKAEGGEGLESKSLLTVNGGSINIHTYDDCINAGTGIVINGGNIFCAASGQDAIDSNGPLTINGGLTIANGVRGDGEAFDAERNFQVNGGIIVGTHGGMAMTSPAGRQRSARIQSSAGSAICIKNAAGEALLLFNIPVIAGATAGSAVIVTFSDPRLVSGSYSLLSGGSIIGGTTVNGYNTGGTYSGGTSKGFTL